MNNTASAGRLPRRTPHTSPRRFNAIARAAAFVRANPVLTVAAVAAAVTCFIVPPDAEYLTYPDFGTLSCLFATLAVVKALANVNFFTWLAAAIVRRTGNLRASVITMVAITYFGSMLIANDMALLTFLPLGYTVMERTGNKRFMAMTFILQNTAANLGGMLTPFGNPQNLYIYSHYSIGGGEFMSVMFPPFIASAVLIAFCCLLFPRIPLTLSASGADISGVTDAAPPRGRTILYCLLFALSVLMVFRVMPYIYGFIAVTAVLLVADRRAVAEVDYPLLLTFFCFFIFAGNMARIDAVRQLFSSLLSGGVLPVSVLSCQFISNVPSAILLSQFTDNYRELLMGVNIGGVGTLISSLASLITFREYTKRMPGHTLRYFLLFSAVSFGFLILLTGFCCLILYLPA